jgi:hypothetical protein
MTVHCSIDPASYRCANCHYRANSTPPSTCPVCDFPTFERYRPIDFGKQQYPVIATVCCIYLIVTRMIGGVLDPAWLIIEAVRAGSLSGGVVGVFLCGILIPGMFCGVSHPRAITFVISAISCILWVAFCWCMWISEFA